MQARTFQVRLPKSEGRKERNEEEEREREREQEKDADGAETTVEWPLDK